MILTDSHVHLKALPLSNKISRALIVSIDESEWSKILEASLEYPSQLIPAFGIHPWYASSINQKDCFERLSRILQSTPNALIGEIGLDSTYRFLNTFSAQEEIFYEQFKLSFTLQKPLSLHVVGGDSVCSLLQYLKRFPLCRPYSASLHSFTGSLTQLRQLRSSFGEKTKVFLGISQKLSGRLPVEKLNRLILEMPENRLLIESDEDECNENILHSLTWGVETISKAKNLELVTTSILIQNNFLEFISFCP